jgi:hypothetical protein
MLDPTNSCECSPLNEEYLSCVLGVREVRVEANTLCRRIAPLDVAKACRFPPEATLSSLMRVIGPRCLQLLLDSGQCVDPDCIEDFSRE